MWLTISKEDNLVKYKTENPPILKADRIIFQDIDVLDLNKDNVTLVEVPEEDLPEDLQVSAFYEFDPKKEGLDRFVKAADIVQPEPIILQKDLYLYVTLTGGDGMSPVGIETTAGADMLGTATLRLAENPLAPVATPFQGKWRVTLRNLDGSIYDVIGVTFVKGVANFAYRATRAAKRGPGVVQLLSSDLEQVEFNNSVFTIHIVGDATFKVYEDA